MRRLATGLPYNSVVLILALDTSSPTGSLAVLDDRKLLGMVSTATGEIYSSRMFRHLDFLLAELSLTLDRIDLFAVASGPGSFTGLRVGLTAVKGWAEVYGKPVAAISALEAVAVQAGIGAETIFPVLDARRSQVYYGMYRRIAGKSAAENSWETIQSEGVATCAELAEKVSATSGSVSIVTPVLELIRASLETAGDESRPRWRVQEISPALAHSVGQLGHAKFLRGELEDALSLNANYVRRSDAELHFKT